ncbi:response regulator transcription factor [Pseudonocardia aurantiaca]|uniref:response regulator transcription factor n=1 Tax=Pseudonocardia aurantiaca TaxID=75290 RepID=UPI0031E34691
MTASDGPRLLVVDDEPNILELLSASLRFAGFTVETAPGGSEALTTVRSFRPDLLLLDVMMPDLTGFELVERLRADGVLAPVIFLTARHDTADKIAGLALGGDDYVTKPFSLEEVIARIRALLRRSGIWGGSGASERLLFADLELDESSHEVRKGGEPVALSPTEFKLLRYLMLNAGKVLSRGQILEHVWSPDYAGDAGVVESYVSYLRRKVDRAEPRLLHTVRGVGYMLRRPR